MDNKMWKVSATQEVNYGRVPQDHGYGFSLMDGHGAPLVSFSFETKEDAKAAEYQMRAALEKVADITFPRR